MRIRDQLNFSGAGCLRIGLTLLSVQKILFLNYLKVCAETLSVILNVICEVFQDRFKVAGHGLV